MRYRLQRNQKARKKVLPIAFGAIKDHTNCFRARNFCLLFLFLCPWSRLVAALFVFWLKICLFLGHHNSTFLSKRYPMKIRTFCSFCCYSLLFFAFFSFSQTFAQKVQFKVTARSVPSGCSAGGTSYDMGYVSTANSQDWVVVAFFVQRKGGYWEKKEYTRQGAGYLKLDLSSCDYTGNYYAFACLAEDKSCSFPDVYQIEAKHNAQDQTPKFRIVKVDKMPCEGGEGAKVESGYVYAPTGGQVEITLFMEKKDGTWRKKTYLYFGTGKLDLDMEGCDLTGNYKATIRYLDN